MTLDNNPFTNAWSNLPNMNAGRWYPTTTVLPNGDSCGLDPTTGVNTLPQVFQVATGARRRSLTSAQLAQELYPTMLLALNGPLCQHSVRKLSLRVYTLER